MDASVTRVEANMVGIMFYEGLAHLHGPSSMFNLSQTTHADLVSLAN